MRGKGTKLGEGIPDFYIQDFYHFQDSGFLHLGLFHLGKVHGTQQSETEIITKIAVILVTLSISFDELCNFRFCFWCF